MSSNERCNDVFYTKTYTKNFKLKKYSFHINLIFLQITLVDIDLGIICWREPSTDLPINANPSGILASLFLSGRTNLEVFISYTGGKQK